MDSSVQAISSAMTAKVRTVRSDAEMTQAAKDFESMFFAQMLQPMFESVEVNDTFGGGHGEQVMRSLIVQEYGKSMALNDTSGLSDAIKNEMIRLQTAQTVEGTI